MLEFLGRMLGKALYEGILLDLPLAGFFLKKFRTQHCDVRGVQSCTRPRPAALMAALCVETSIKPFLPLVLSISRGNPCCA